MPASAATGVYAPLRVDKANQIEIELSLPGLEAFVANGLPGVPQDNTVSPPPVSAPSAGSPTWSVLGA